MYVSRRTKWLLKKGYIRRVRGHENPALYRVTDKHFPALGESPETCNARDQWDWSEIFEEDSWGGHYNAWKFKVLGPPLKGWPWENWDKIGDQKPPHYFKKNFPIDTEEGTITIRKLRYINGRENKSITVWLDHDKFETNHEMLSWRKDSQTKLILIGREIQYMTGIYLSLPNQIDDPHLTKRVRKGVAKAYKRLGLGSDRKFIDNSEGKDKPHLEVKDERDAIAIETVPDRVENLEDEVTEAALERARLTIEARNNYEIVTNGTSVVRRAQDNLNQAQADFNQAVAERLTDEPTDTEDRDGAEAPTTPNIHDMMYH